MPRARAVALTTAVAALGLAGPALATPQAGVVRVPSETGQLILGADPGGLLGLTLSAAGDHDGDGRRDLLADYLRYDPFDTRVGVFSRGGFGGVLALSGVAVPPAAGYEIRETERASLDGPLSAKAGVGDVNGDGRTDIAVMRSFPSLRTTIVYGKAGQRPSLELGDAIDPADGFDIDGVGTSAVSSAGDFNGDGVGDIALGQRPGAGSMSTVHVVFGQAGPRASYTVGPAPGSVRIDAPSFGAGGPLVSPAGDVNGDRVDDVLVGYPTADTGRGRAAVVYGAAQSPPTVEVSDDMPQGRGFAMVPPAGSRRAGAGIADAGDVNGDGLADVAVGAPGLGGGVVWTVFGRKLASTVPLSTAGFALGHVYRVASGATNFGQTLDGIGDVNGDGRADLVVGAPRSTQNPGLAYVLRSPSPTAGTVVLPSTVSTPSMPAKPFDPAVGFRIEPDPGTPVSAIGGFGWAVAGLGDGRVAVAAPLGGGALSGAVHVIDARATRPLRGLLTLTATVAKPTLAARSALEVALRTSEVADVVMTVYRVGTGRSCVADSSFGTVVQRCRPALALAGTTRLGGRTAGARTARFAAKLKGKALPAGTYLGVLRAGAGARRSLLTTVKFRIRE